MDLPLTDEDLVAVRVRLQQIDREALHDLDSLAKTKVLDDEQLMRLVDHIARLLTNEFDEEWVPSARGLRFEATIDVLLKAKSDYWSE